MKSKVIIAALFLLTSCSADWHLKRAIKKGIALQKDTISVVDTVLTKEVYHDTTVVTKTNDTLTFHKDQWHVKIVRINDTLHVQGGCKTDTLIVERKIPIDRIVNKIDYWSGIVVFLKWLVVLAAMLVGGWVVFKKL
jgi:hypothetical protein